jgi:uncharacterized protein YecE (DUF72 family)
VNLYIGTSGWNYDHWKGIFYPEGLPSSKWLDHYTRSFNSVELNVTFYRLVRKETFRMWRKNTPEDFRFVTKGSRFITHIKRIKSVAGALDLFLNNVHQLREKLLAVIWQLPPNYKKDLSRLEGFLRLLKRKTKVPQVLEFRHESWFSEDVYALLTEHEAALCIAHSHKYPCVRVQTGNLLYLRFHGATLYKSDYSKAELKPWAKYAKSVKDKDIMVFFNNDTNGYAIKNAITFHKLMTDR